MPSKREIAEASFAAFQRGDLDAAFEHVHPGFVYENRTDAPGAEGTWHGREGFLTMMSHILEAFSEYRVDLIGVRELDDDRVELLLSEFGRGRSTGIEFTRRIRSIYHFADDQVTKIESVVDSSQG